MEVTYFRLQRIFNNPGTWELELRSNATDSVVEITIAAVLFDTKGPIQRLDGSERAMTCSQEPPASLSVVKVTGIWGPLRSSLDECEMYRSQGEGKEVKTTCS